MKKIFLVFFFLFLYNIGTAADYKKLLDEVSILYKKKDFKNAEILLKSAIKKDTSFYYLYLYLGQVQWANSKLNDALNSFNKANEKNPRSSQILLARAQLREELNDSLGALEDLDMAVDKHPLEFHGLYERGLYHKFHENYELALKDLEKAVLVDSTHFNVRFHIATIKKKQGKMYESLIDYTALAIKFPEKSVVWNNLADTEMLLNDFECALEHIEKSLAVNPKYPTAFLTRGQIYLKLKEDSRACEDFRKAFELGDEKMKERVKAYLVNCK